MDPLGFGLENFDAHRPLARPRSAASRSIPPACWRTARSSAGPAELKRHLREQKEEFVRNLTEKMLAYALGRGLEPYDIPTVKQITRSRRRRTATAARP